LVAGTALAAIHTDDAGRNVAFLSAFWSALHYCHTWDQVAGRAGGVWQRAHGLGIQAGQAVQGGGEGMRL
jgi:hypothetical protein